MARETDAAESSPQGSRHPKPPHLFTLPSPGDPGMPTDEQFAHHPIPAAQYEVEVATANSTFKDAVQSADAALSSANEALETAQGTYNAAIQTYRSAIEVARAKIIEDYRTAISTFTQSALGS